MCAGIMRNVLNIFININQVNYPKTFVALFIQTLLESVECNEFLN